MNILVHSPDFPPVTGGIATFVSQLCGGLSARGHDVDVVTIGHPDLTIPLPLGSTIYRYEATRRPASLAATRAIMSRCRTRHYDVALVGHLMSTQGLGVLAATIRRQLPYAILTHGNDLWSNRRSLIDAVASSVLMRQAGLLLANSEYTANVIRSRVRHIPVEVLNPGVDTHRFRPGLDTSAVRREYSLRDRQVVLTVGRLVARKGYAQVLRALPRVIQHVPQLLYLIAGSGPQEARLRHSVSCLQLHDHVRFLGHVPANRLPELYCASDLFVMPCISMDHEHDVEGFGIVFSEAAACGIPVIAGNSGGAAEAVEHRRTGLVVDGRDVAAIESAMVRVLCDADCADRLGRAGRLRAERKLAWPSQCASLEQMLNRLSPRREAYA